MANKTDIIDEIEGLAVHCRPPLMQVEQRESWLRDWCNDLAGFDIEALRGGCREWRQSGATKFPTPGQLLPLVRKRTASSAPPSHIAEPWRPLSDAEYADLSLPAKIRHCQILAREARTEAIKRAMAAGWDRNVANAPASYRSFMAVADGHDAEAKRLRGHLRSFPIAAE